MLPNAVLMNPRIPEYLRPLAQDYLTSVEGALPGLVTGFYLHGSLALDAFDPSQSDVDFVAVVSRSCTALDAQSLAAVHQQLEFAYPKWPMQGSYLLAGDLGQPLSAPSPHYSDGRLTRDHTDSENPVTWWLLKRRSIALLGPTPDQLGYSLDRNALNAWLLGNLNSYWRGFTRDPRRMAWLLSDYGVQWAVLGVLRQVHTLREGDITSKLGAGAYGLETQPQRWRRLIREAIAMRQKTGGRLYASRAGRALEAIQFLTTTIRTCNQNAAAESEKVIA